MTVPDLYILRHGETRWNAENRMQGALNSPLTQKGRAQAAQQAQILSRRDLSGFRFYSSPQMRAIETAAIALADIAASVITDERLREIGVGDWAGRRRSSLPVPDGPNPEMGQYNMAPGGEGFAALKTRCQSFLDDLSGPAVLVTHGVTGAVLRALLVGEGAYATASVHGGQGCVFYLAGGQQTILD